MSNVGATFIVYVFVVPVVMFLNVAVHKLNGPEAWNSFNSIVFPVMLGLPREWYVPF